MNRRAVTIVVAVVLVIVGINWSRFARNMGEPALLHEPSGVWVQLGNGFSPPGLIRQFNDDCRLASVIDLTTYDIDADVQKNLEVNPLVESGRRIDLIVQGSEIQSISFSWMTAGQRVALGIALHPDRMSVEDWVFLPGIGVKTAVKIEADRQKNGDFGEFAGLRRIKGVGSGKMAAWRHFF